MERYKSIFLWISRIVIGVIFIYSGFVKAVDPFGSTYKFNDYFIAFGANWASIFSFGLAIILSSAEFIIGVSLFLNLKITKGIWGAILLMAVFTPLTFILALTNPVQDCGCFGDALILTNWQTFWKNIVLLIPLIYLFIHKKDIRNSLTNMEQWFSVGIISVFIIAISWYSINHLPLLDFRPYKIGTYIPAAMEIPENEPADVWESIFIYSKDGTEKEFTLNNLPDSTWAFVDAKHVLISKGYEPPIHDFSLLGSDGSDITDMVLASSNYNFLLIAHNLDKSDKKNQKEINNLASFCQSKGYSFYCLTATGDEGIETFKKETNASYEFYHTDEITLKTIVRSNPGLILLKEGAILGKWHSNDIPSPDELDENITHQLVTDYKKKADKYYIYTLILLSAFISSTYLLIRRKMLTNKA